MRFRVFMTTTSVDITVYQYGKNVLYLFYNIAMLKARRIRKISVFTSGGRFFAFTLSYVNTALNQSKLPYVNGETITPVLILMETGEKYL